MKAIRLSEFGGPLMFTDVLVKIKSTVSLREGKAMTNLSSPRLSGRVCVITGTGGSIGRAAAVAFAREGASVVGCDVNVAAAEATVEMVRAQGGTMISLQPLNALLSFKTLPSLSHTTAKAGIIGMTRQLAMEGREHGHARP